MTPPWINIPPVGYGGLEYVVHYLVDELVKQGVHVEVFSVGNSSLTAQNHWYYEDGQYRHISKPLYDAVTLPITQILFSLNKIRNAGFDIIHDHNGFLGPAMMSDLDPSEYPPVLHTLHGPFSNDEMVANGMPDNRPMYSQLGNAHRLFFNGISKAQLKDAPPELASRLVGVVYNAVALEAFPLQTKKSDYFITFARFARDKGQALAAKLCEELGLKLHMAGIVDGIENPKQLIVELANANSRHRNNADFIYYREQVLPHLKPGQIEYVGSVSGQQRMDFLGQAKALLFPIDWEEPFGMAAIEALSCGTPVVAMKRGALPEIIQHGVNGFLAKNEAEFKSYMGRVDEINPSDCRSSVVDKFSAPTMARAYLEKYQQIIDS